MTTLDAETTEAIRAAVRQELAALLGYTRPPDLPDRPALHEAPPVRTKAIGPYMAGGCAAVTYDGLSYRHCSHPASTTRDGHPSCGVHARKDRPEPRWADPAGDTFSGI